MKVTEIQFTPWDKAYWFDTSNSSLEIEDKVVVHTELGMEIGLVIGFKEIDEEKLKNREIKKIIRKANISDLEKIAKKNSQKQKVLNEVHQYIVKHKLEMKLTDIHFSFDGGRMTFAFISDGRVDFRELVKDLTRHYQKSIRFHQIGVRDEAKYCGSIGPCGKKLCCRTFLKELGQVTSDFVECQQIAHRGSDRLSGMCGRLKCCLRFEQDLYIDLANNLPKIGTRVRTDHGRGEVIAHRILKQSVNVRLDGKDKTIVEIPIKKDKPRKSV